MVGHGGSSAGSYLADPTSPIPSHCASIVATSIVRVNKFQPLNRYVVPGVKSEPYLAGNPMRAQFSKTEWRGNLPEQGDHVQMLDSSSV